MKVKKRDGTLQQLDIQKIHDVLEWACNGGGDCDLTRIKGVSLSEIEMKAHLQLHDKITTKEIHECLIKAASELISEDTPNYDHVAARLRWFAVRKEAFGTNNPPPLYDIVKKNTKLGLYDIDIINMYSEQEWNTIDSFVDHNRDDLFRYAGAEQMSKKYLVQNRKTKQVYESFQIPYILVSAILFNTYSKETRLSFVKRYYDQVSQHFVSLPTPIMAGLRTKVKQFSSCTVIDTGDSLDSIKLASNAIVDYASRKAGIGLNIGRIRAVGQPVRNGDAVTTGVLPFAKLFAAALKSCSQGAVRGASATFNFPIWHLEFETLIELKNNKGTEETRLRTVDYCVHLNKTMYERLVANSHITFFTPDEVPDLYEAFYGPADKFKELYEKYENDKTKTKKQLPAKEVFAKLMTERFDTGRIYVMHADLANVNTPFKEKIYMTNLCVEILIANKPLKKDGGEIALCTLSATNWGIIDTEEQMREACEMAVRGLDSLLTYQEYPNEYAKLNVKNYRPLGVGIIGFAHWLAKNNLQWGISSEQQVNDKIDSMMYHLIDTSVQLSEEFGSCDKSTKYHDGIMPGKSDRWHKLAEKAKQHGIRNAVLSALMPSETSSTLSNETNGIEPPKSLVTIKGSKDGVMAQVVPGIHKYGHRYQKAWDVSVSDYLFTVGVLQRYVDQSISANTSYNPQKQEITTGILIKDLLGAYKNGVKTLYYNNTLDDAPEIEDDGCAGGACKL
jgi:ribonucleoside-diphosphate reductase alpha chain